MLESIGLGLVKTMITYLFKFYMQSESKENTITIGGAPSWYEKREDPDKLYGFAFAEGGLTSVDAAKERVKERLVIQIRTAMDTVVARDFSRLKGKEKMLVERMRNDMKLDGFVSANMEIVGLHFDEKNSRAFAGACLTKAQVERYSTQRVYEIKKELLDVRFDSMMHELEEAS